MYIWCQSSSTSWPLKTICLYIDVFFFHYFFVLFLFWTFFPFYLMFSLHFTLFVSSFSNFQIGQIFVNCLYPIFKVNENNINSSTAWKVSKYGVVSCMYFPAFGMNTEIYYVNLHIQSEYRKIRTRNNSLFWTLFHAVIIAHIEYNTKKSIWQAFNVRIFQCLNILFNPF